MTEIVKPRLLISSGSAVDFTLTTTTIDGLRQRSESLGAWEFRVGAHCVGHYDVNFLLQKISTTESLLAAAMIEAARLGKERDELRIAHDELRCSR